MTDAHEDLARLLREAGAAHHRAFAATDGEDPDWSRWYAEYLAPRLEALLGRSYAVEGLAEQLERLAEEHQRAGSGRPWAEYYARGLLRGRSE